MVAPTGTTDYASSAASGAAEGVLRGSHLMQKLKKFCVYLLCVHLLNAVPSFAGAGSKPEESALDQIRAYISTGWESLTRSQNDCATVVDTKLTAASVLYLPADFAEPVSVQQLQKQCNVKVLHLPAVIHHIGEICGGFLIVFTVQRLDNNTET